MIFINFPYPLSIVKVSSTPNDNHVITWYDDNIGEYTTAAFEKDEELFSIGDPDRNPRERLWLKDHNKTVEWLIERYG